MKTIRYLMAVSGVILFSLTRTLSQQIEVTSSKFDVLNSVIRLHKIFGHDENHFFVIKNTGTIYYIEKLDRNLNHVAEEPVKLFKGLRTYQLEAVFHFYDEIYLFVSRARINDITLYYQRISKNTLLPVSDELVEITTIKNIKGAWADFHFALSKHETKLMIAARTKLVWSGAQFNEFFVFGAGLELLWKKKDSFEFRGQGPRDNLYIVDETGNVSILSLIKRESILSLLRENRNLYSIYRYTQEGNEYNEYPVTLEKDYIRGIRIIAGENGELICAGLYSEMFKTGIRGTFFFKIDAASGQIYDRHQNEFDRSVMADLEVMKEPMIREEELISYVISDIVLRDQGRVIIIAEQIFHQSYNTYNNLIVTCYDPYGSVFWTRVIPKNQNFNNSNLDIENVDLFDYRDFLRETGYMDPGVDNYCSYALMAPLNKSGIILFMNDDVRNMEQTEKYRPLSRIRKSYILAVAIDEFGNITRTPLIPWKKRMLFPQPMRYYDTLGDTIVIPAYRYRNINYYKFTADAIP